LWGLCHSGAERTELARVSAAQEWQKARNGLAISFWPPLWGSPEHGSAEVIPYSRPITGEASAVTEVFAFRVEVSGSLDHGSGEKQKGPKGSAGLLRPPPFRISEGAGGNPV